MKSIFVKYSRSIRIITGAILIVNAFRVWGLTSGNLPTASHKLHLHAGQPICVIHIPFKDIVSHSILYLTLDILIQIWNCTSCWLYLLCRNIMTNMSLPRDMRVFDLDYHRYQEDWSSSFIGWLWLFPINSDTKGQMVTGKLCICSQREHVVVKSNGPSPSCTICDDWVLLVISECLILATMY